MQLNKQPSIAQISLKNALGLCCSFLCLRIYFCCFLHMHMITTKVQLKLTYHPRKYIYFTNAEQQGSVVTK